MHLPDIFLFQPVFHEGSLLGWAGCVAHHIDVGGRVPGGNAADSTSIYQEAGIPVLPFYKAGRRNEDLVRILERNVRLPGILLGDLGAQMTARHVGERGLRNSRGMAATVSTPISMGSSTTPSDWRAPPSPECRMASTASPTIWTTTVWVRDRSASRWRCASGRRCPCVDFAGTSPQVKAALNATVSYAKASVYCALLSAIDSSENFNNDGLYRCVHVSVPEGTILNPLRPAPRAARGLTGFRVIDTVFGALQAAIPARALAAGEGGANMITISQETQQRESILVNFLRRLVDATA